MFHSVLNCANALGLTLITAFAMSTLPMQAANAFNSHNMTDRAIDRAINQLPQKPFTYSERYWGGPPGSKIGPALTGSCERDILAGLAFADDSYRAAEARNLVTGDEAARWRAARAQTAQVMTANLMEQQIFNACIYRRQRIGELNSLLPQITLSNETFVTCDREVETHRTAFTEQLGVARAGAFKTSKATRIAALEASTTAAYNNYRASQPQGVTSLRACDATSQQIYTNAVQMVFCRFGRCR